MGTGLAVDQSDVDIAICGMKKAPDPAAPLAHMSKLSTRLQAEKFVLKCTFIQTARVPVIKIVQERGNGIGGGVT